MNLTDNEDVFSAMVKPSNVDKHALIFFVQCIYFVNLLCICYKLLV